MYKITHCLVTVISLSVSLPIMAERASVKECQRYINKAAQYEQKRRAGGTGAQMDEWKKKQRAYDQKFFSG